MQTKPLIALMLLGVALATVLYNSNKLNKTGERRLGIAPRGQAITNVSPLLSKGAAGGGQLADVSSAPAPFPLPPKLVAPPVTLPQRPKQSRQLSPSREEVQKLMLRMSRGPEQEPDYEKLHRQLATLDFRDYPDEYVQIVRDMGWRHHLANEMRPRFMVNDEPAFVVALIKRLEVEKDTASEFTLIELANLLGNMTASPALVPELIKGLESTGSDRVYNACERALSTLATPEAARALVRQSIVASDNPREDDISRKSYCLLAIAGLRNQALIPYLESELAKTQDPRLAMHLKGAIIGTQRGWPQYLSDEQWKIVSAQ